MSSRAIIVAVAGLFIAATHATATTYYYHGQPNPSTGDYLTATVDLNCITCAGDYHYFSGGIIDYQLMFFNGSNAVIFPATNLNYAASITLSADGASVTEWDIVGGYDEHAAFGSYRLSTYSTISS